VTLALDCAAEQGVCTGERLREICSHVRGSPRAQASASASRSPSGTHRPLWQPSGVALADRSCGHRRGAHMDPDGRRSAPVERKSLLLTRLRVPRDLHCQPAKRSTAVKSGPTGPSASEPRRGALDGRAERSYLGSRAGDPPKVSPTIIPGEPVLGGRDSQAVTTLAMLSPIAGRTRRHAKFGRLPMQDRNREPSDRRKPTPVLGGSTSGERESLWRGR
jgi:hypothetical protein